MGVRINDAHWGSQCVQDGSLWKNHVLVAGACVFSLRRPRAVSSLLAGAACAFALHLTSDDATPLNCHSAQQALPHRSRQCYRCCMSSPKREICTRTPHPFLCLCLYFFLPILEVLRQAQRAKSAVGKLALVEVRSHLRRLLSPCPISDTKTQRSSHAE